MPSCAKRSTTTRTAASRSRTLATRLRYDRSVLSRADDLAKMTVLDENKRAIELGALWRDKPAVLVFIRHFG